VENSPLLTLNPLVLLLGVLCMGAAGYISARVFSKTNDIKKSVKLYIPISAGIAVVLVIVTVPIIISIGLMGFGLVVLVYVSNYYFYK